jgi:ADP-ribosylglycohydrolase
MLAMAPNALPPDHETRMQRVRLALEGLSVGDAFGERFFSAQDLPGLIEARALPAPPWRYTDDTVMAVSVAEVLDWHGRIEQDELAAAFARRYLANPNRGYGATAHKVLMAIAAGGDWRGASSCAFGGMGSMGNGGAMRVAPVAAYFADDIEAVVREARASAEVTHAHAEGQAGAIAVAVAGAVAWQLRQEPDGGNPRQFLAAACKHTPPGETRYGLMRAVGLPWDASVAQAVETLGNGSRVTAPDTVPFALWCAARHRHDYVQAMWTTVEGLGDIDTNCAIVGAIVALACGPGAIPQEWLDAREWLAV